MEETVPAKEQRFSCRGSLVALVTPMKSSCEGGAGGGSDSVDFESLRRLVEWHIKEQTSAIVVGGTTGESATLTFAEFAEITRFTVDVADNRIPIIAGTGSNSTSVAIQKTQTAAALGASAALCVTPYYNKPTQEGLFQHFKAVASAVPWLPLILYNVPARTACDLSPETVKRLQDTCVSIVGIKEACGDLERFKELRKLCGVEFFVFSGEDGSCVSDILNGDANGVVSVTANVLPREMQFVCTAALNGRKELALRMQKALQPLHTALFVEPNPTAVKFLLRELEKIDAGTIRLPLLPLSQKLQDSVRKAYKEASSDSHRMLDSENGI